MCGLELKVLALAGNRVLHLGVYQNFVLEADRNAVAHFLGILLCDCRPTHRNGG